MCYSGRIYGDADKLGQSCVYLLSYFHIASIWCWIFVLYLKQRKAVRENMEVQPDQVDLNLVRLPSYIYEKYLISKAAGIRGLVLGIFNLGKISA